MADYRAEYESRNRKRGSQRDGSHKLLAALASGNGPVTVSLPDVSKWLRGPKTVYRHGIDHGTGKDLAIRNAIRLYLLSHTQLMDDYRAKYESRNRKRDGQRDGSHKHLVDLASESGSVEVSHQDVSNWLHDPKAGDRHSIDNKKDLAIRNAIGRYLIES